jgi:chromosomal replication initiator protein
VTDLLPPDGPAAGSASPLTLEQVWTSAVEGLPESALSAQHRAWVKLTRPLGLVEDTALLAAPNEFAKDVLDSRLRPVLSGALSAAYGREIRGAVTVQPGPAPVAVPEVEPPAPDPFGASAPAATPDSAVQARSEPEPAWNEPPRRRTTAPTAAGCTRCRPPATSPAAVGRPPSRPG